MNTADEWAKALDARNHGSGMHDPETNHRLTVVIEKRLANNANTIRAAQTEAWDAGVAEAIEHVQLVMGERAVPVVKILSCLKGKCP